MVKILVSLLLLLPVPAFAEEVVPAPEPVAEAPAQVIEAPSDEVGGWAVIDPNTNTVHGVIVCTESVCGQNGSFKGVMPQDTACPGCILRLQTKAMDNGNVAGWHGENVKYNPDDGSYDITETYNTNNATVTEKKKLIPSKTASDGKTLETGFVSSDKKVETAIDNSSASVDMKKNLEANTVTSVKVKVMDLGDTELTYNSDTSALFSLDSDIDTTIENQDIEDPIVISTIKELTSRIKQFIQGIFTW